MYRASIAGQRHVFEDLVALLAKAGLARRGRARSNARRAGTAARAATGVRAQHASASCGHGLPSKKLLKRAV